MTQYDLECQWITDEGIHGVDICYGEQVRVKRPEHRDDEFIVIALLSLNPTPTFGVTRTTDEHFLVVSQEELEATGVSSDRKLVLHKPGEKPKYSN